MASDLLNFNFDSISNLILQNVRNLRSLSITDEANSIADSLISGLLTKCRKTLIDIDVPNFLAIPNVKFDNLSEIQINIPEFSLSEFYLKLEEFVKNAPSLKIFHIFEFSQIEEQKCVSDYFMSKYKKECCVHSYDADVPFPVKILECYVSGVSNPLRFQFKNSILFLRLTICTLLPEKYDSWRNIFLQFPNLKGILFFDWYKKRFLVEDDFLSQDEEMSDEIFNIWKERPTLLHSLGIKILTQSEFESKKIEISEHLPWFFTFSNFSS